ncbi:MAG: DUF3313 family protein [Reyranella sp.]|uniref:DUF3313 family protein n=1 Tax=Reyranella sp. TaxID=1929291 RepID=UPI003D0F36F6
MFEIRHAACALTGIVVCTFSTCIPTSLADEPLPDTHEGLELVPGSSLQLSYRRRGVNFAEYTSVMIDPVQFAFSDEWNKDFPKVIASRQQRFGEDLAQAMRARLSEDLDAHGGYPTAEQPRPDVLRISVVIAELYVTVPDQSFSADAAMFGKVRTQGLLIVEMRDSVSGLLLVRLADRTRAEREMTGEQMRDTRMRADTELVLERWISGIREAVTSAMVASK